MLSAALLAKHLALKSGSEDEDTISGYSKNIHYVY